jgi:iron complex transport system substrate-binding protein
LELRAKITRDNTVSKIVDYIETHFSQDISTATLCEYFGYTATHLGRKFKEETGLSPVNYIKIYRMEVAYKLLKSGKRNVSEIAIQCGYPDPNYFTRCFKNHFGVAPSKLKKIEG